MNKDIFSIILQQSKLSKNIFIYNENISYKDFYKCVDQYYNFFVKNNIEKNRAICINMHYSIDFISIIFAAYLNKNPITILNNNCSIKERNHVLESTKSEVIFFNKEQDIKGKKVFYNSKNIFYKKINQTKINIFNNNDRFIIFTSGTTNKPKGAILTTQCFSNNIVSIKEDLKIQKKDKTIIFSPPAYAMGISQIFSFMYSKAKISFYNEGLRFPHELINKFIKTDITILNISVSAYRIIAKFFDSKIKFKKIRIIMSGGMPLTKEVFLEYKKIFPNANVVNFYGCTENSPRISHYQTKSWNSKENYLPVGKPLKDIKIKILKKSKDYKFGEILISGSSLMRGYLINHTIIKKLYKNIWFKTGDIGYHDSAKNIYLKGRSDNIFSVGHEKLYPEEIENIIKKIFKFNEVVIVKKKHKILNWVPVALIDKGLQKKITIDNFKKRCKKYLSSFKVPNEIMFSKNIPKNNYGKIDRKKIEVYLNENR